LTTAALGTAILLRRRKSNHLISNLFL
jgi:hypothetical protein